MSRNSVLEVESLAIEPTVECDCILLLSADKDFKTYCMTRTPVDLYRRFLECWYLKQIVVGEIIVADTVLSTVVQSVAHTASTVIVADQIATDGVWFTVETTNATFIYICNNTPCKTV